MIPDLSSILSGVENYRYSITIGIGLLFFAPMFLSVSWAAASTTWRYGVGFLFFLSIAMILTKDVWPFIRRQIWGYSKTKEKEYATLLIKKCKQKGGSPPFEIDIQDVVEDKDLLLGFIEALSGAKVNEDKIKVDEKMLQKLKSHL